MCRHRESPDTTGKFYIMAVAELVRQIAPPVAKLVIALLGSQRDNGQTKIPRPRG